MPLFINKRDYMVGWVAKVASLGSVHQSLTIPHKATQQANASLM